MPVILAGDIGGTKTVLGLFEGGDGELRQSSEATFPSSAHGSLEEILAIFLREGARARIDAACFGVAGAVVDGHAETTNLPWKLDEATLAEACGAPRTRLLNDLEAAAYGMLVLGLDDRAVLNPARSPGPRGNAAVISAGTGLGEATLFWDGSRYRAVASEGGHADFAPRNDLEIDLLRFLQSEFGSHVSYERVLSGPGLFNVYRFLRTREDQAEPGWLCDALAEEDPSAVVARAGLEERDPVCTATLDLFASIYGAEAGNLALRCVAVDGVFIGGGIAPKILPALQKPAFMEAFVAKGRFEKMLRGTLVSVALNPRAPLLGAAQHAASLVGEHP